MAYTPVELTKNGKTRTASTLEEEIDLRWDGWLPTGGAVPYPRPLKQLVGAETEAALGAAYGPLVGANHRPLTVLRSGKMLYTMKAGHTWTVAGAASSNLNNTSDYLLGSQSATMTTDGAGTYASLTQSPSTVLDATGRNLYVLVKVDNPANMSQLILYAGTGGLSNYYAWIFAISGFDIVTNGWAVISLPWGEASTTGTPNRASLDTFKLQVKDKGAGAITVAFNGVGSAPAVSSVFPNGVVSFTFDDSRISQYTQGRLKLDQYGYRATAYTICNLIGANDSLYMNETQLHELEELHGWEIAAHAYTEALHTATGGYTALSAADLETEIRALKVWGLQRGFGGWDHFAYPQGLSSTTVRDTVGRYFQTARSYTNTFVETLPPGDRRALRSEGVSNTTTVAQMEAKVDKAYANAGWDIITIHDILSTASSATQMTIADFGTLVDYVAGKGVAVRPVGDVLRALA